MRPPSRDAQARKPAFRALQGRLGEPEGPLRLGPAQFQLQPVLKPLVPSRTPLLWTPGHSN